MPRRKSTGIPENEKSPVIGVEGGIDGHSEDSGGWYMGGLYDEANDESDERFADEDNPEPLDKLFR